MICKFKILPIFILIFLSCQKHEWNNPFDSECPKEIFTPANFTAIQQGNGIILNWNQKSTQISGFNIYKNSKDDTWTQLTSFGKSTTSYTDSLISGGNKYGYKLVAIAGSNKSNEVIAYCTPILGATITTNSVASITSTTATTGGNISSDGGAQVTSRGVCYGTNQNPSVTGSKTNDGTGTGNFHSSLSGLIPNTTYYVRAYAINSTGTTYGEEISFKTLIVQIPTVTTSAITTFTSTMVILGGNVISDGNTTVTERGVCYSTSQNPTTANNKTVIGSGTGTFSTTVSGLKTDTTYYIRAFAINSQGTAYGNQIFFIPPPLTGSGTFIDSRDGNTYKWIKIGMQAWMAENLAYLPAVYSVSVGSDTAPFYYVIGYEGTDTNAAMTTANYSTFGVLYNWPAAMTACPQGWHLPSNEEWIALYNYLIYNGFGYEGSGDDIGKSLAANTMWGYNSTPGAPGNDPSSNNSSGFSGLPGGYRGRNGVFYSLGHFGLWWSSSGSTVIPTTHRMCWSLTYHSTFISRFGEFKDNGLSVRCIRDF